MSLVKSLRKAVRQSWCNRNLAEGRLLFGKYLLIRQLGQGGYFKAWLARHKNLDRNVVVRFMYGLNRYDAKRFPSYTPIISENSGKEIDWEDRLFSKESQILGGLEKHILNHQYGKRIQRVYDSQAGSFWCPSFMVTEEITGDNLYRYIGKGKLDVSFVMKIAGQVAEGLAVLHTFPEMPLVHRDLNPGNIILQDSGEIKIIDFGACLGINECFQNNLTPNSIRFRSPEQWDGIVGFEADNYAWAMNVYSLLAGKLPHDDCMWDRKKMSYEDFGQERKRFAERIRTEELPDIRKLVPDVCDDFGELTMRNMDRDPKKRCRNGAELLEEIRLCGTIKNYVRKKKPREGLAKIIAERKIKPLLEIIQPGECPMVVENKKWTCLKKGAATNMFWFGLLDLCHQETGDRVFLDYMKKSVEAFEHLELNAETHSNTLMSYMHCLAIADFEKYQNIIFEGITFLSNRFLTFDSDAVKIINADTEEKEIVGFRNLQKGINNKSKQGIILSRESKDGCDIFVDFIYPYYLFCQKVKPHVSDPVSKQLDDIARMCLHTTLEFFQRADGSFGEGGYLSFNNALLAPKMNIGYGVLSHCARSNFRVLQGGVEYLLSNEDSFVLERIVRLADYCCNMLSKHKDMPAYDFEVSDTEYFPDSATIIGARGLYRLANLLSKQNGNLAKIQNYLTVSSHIFNTSLIPVSNGKEYFCVDELQLTPDFHQALLLHSYRDSYRKDTSLIVSDFELLKNLIEIKI